MFAGPDGANLLTGLVAKLLLIRYLPAPPWLVEGFGLLAEEEYTGKGRHGSRIGVAPVKGTTTPYSGRFMIAEKDGVVGLPLCSAIVNGQKRVQRLDSEAGRRKLRERVEASRDRPWVELFGLALDELTDEDRMQALSIVSWLFHDHRDGFVRYLQLMREELPSVGADAKERIAAICAESLGRAMKVELNEARKSWVESL